MGKRASAGRTRADRTFLNAPATTSERNDAAAKAKRLGISLAELIRRAVKEWEPRAMAVAILVALAVGCGGSATSDPFPPCVQTPGQRTTCEGNGVCIHIGGGATFCTHECTTDGDCTDGTCIDVSDSPGTRVCAP